MNFKRILTKHLMEDLRHRRSILLLGPRQTGKSTLIKEVLRSFPGSLEYPLQLPSVRTRLEQDPEILLREAGKEGLPRVVFIDEIQKTPALLDILQYLLDEKRIVLVASGSSARKMRHGAKNWLPGRIQLRHLYPLTWSERGMISAGEGGHALLEERMLYGGLPGVLQETNNSVRRDILSSYTALYLEEEIRQEAAVRRLPPFATFLRLAALESGQSPNFSKLALEVGVSHTTLAQYYTVLEDSLILHRIPAFGIHRAAVLRKPRYYFFDIGVRNAAARLEHGPGILPLQKGTLFEHAVVLEIIATSPPGTRLSYWRTKRGEEVDLILEKGNHRVPIEIKWTENPRESDFAGLAAFRDQEKSKVGYLLCRIPRPQTFRQGIALPWHCLQDTLAHL